MTAISELKMHIRDENLRNQTKTQLKHEFATRTHPTMAADASATTSSLPLASNPSQPQPPTTSSDNARACNSGIDSGSFDEQPTNDFQAIVDHHAQLVDEDDHDNDPTTTPTTLQHPIKIVDLFDFTRSHWVKMYSKTPQRSSEEELELYELLDLDGEGGEDANIDVDDSTADVLLG
jgi:hypothetical protein